MKVYLATILTLFMMLGCSEDPQTDLSERSNSDSQKALSVILITDVGGLGDKGFNDAGWEGCQDAKQRLSERGVSVETRVIESREQSDYSENLAMAAERADAVVALGFLIADAVEAIAPNYPETAFIFIDGSVPGENVASFEFRSNEAAFLGGIITAYMTETNVVGVVPGMDIPPVENYAAGYRAGVQMGAELQNKRIQTLSTTIGSFTDPVKGKSITQSLLGQNADIVLQLAGISGLGVIEAIKENSGRAFAVGGDINQDDLAPGKVLYSILKRMNRVVLKVAISTLVLMKVMWG